VQASFGVVWCGVVMYCIKYCCCAWLFECADVLLRNCSLTHVWLFDAFFVLCAKLVNVTSTGDFLFHTAMLTQ